MEDEYETTYEKQDDGTTHMQKGVLVLTDAQHKALQVHGIAWHYDDAAWTQNGTEGSIYQNVSLPEGAVQIELREDGTIVKHRIGDDARLAKRILGILPTLSAFSEGPSGDVVQRMVLIERILKDEAGRTEEE